MLKFKDIKIPIYDISLLLFVLYMFRQTLWNSDPLLRSIVMLFIGISIFKIINDGLIQKRQLTYTLWVGIVCFITMIVSYMSVYSLQSFSSLQNMFRAGIYVSLVLIHCKEKKDLDKLLLFVWIAGLSVVISLIQNFDPRAVALVDEAYATSTRLGLGGIEHPNTTAYNLFISFAVGVYLFIRYKSNIKARYGILLGEIFLVAGCLLTGSRKVLITIILLPLIIFILKSKNPLKLASQIIIGAFIIVIIYNFTQSNAVLYNLIGHRISDISGIFEGEDASAAGRGNLIIEGLQVGFEYFWGVGLNCFSFYSSDGAYAHNEFVEIFVDLGVIGFFAYYTPIIVVIKKLIQYYKMEKCDISMFWFSLIVNILILSLFQVTFAFFTYHLILGLFFTKKYMLIEESCHDK